MAHSRPCALPARQQVVQSGQRQPWPTPNVAQWHQMGSCNHDHSPLHSRWTLTL